MSINRFVLALMITICFSACKKYDNEISDLKKQISDLQKQIDEVKSNYDELMAALKNRKLIVSATETSAGFTFLFDDNSTLFISKSNISQAPYIGANGNWFVNNQDTGVSAMGTNGSTPYIGQNGNWFIGGVDSGVKAAGSNGQTPSIGSNGNWFIGSSDTGVKAVGSNGVNGTNGISPSIGVSGNWFIGTQDTGVKAVGSDAPRITSIIQVNSALEFRFSDGSVISLPFDPAVTVGQTWSKFFEIGNALSYYRGMNRIMSFFYHQNYFEIRLTDFNGTIIWRRIKDDLLAVTPLQYSYFYYYVFEKDLNVYFIIVIDGNYYLNSIDDSGVLGNFVKLKLDGTLISGYSLQDFIVDESGFYFSATKLLPVAGESAGRIAKFDLSGNFIWASPLVTPLENIYSIEKSGDFIYGLGNKGSYPLILKLDVNGNVLIKNVSNSIGNGGELVQALDGRIYGRLGKSVNLINTDLSLGARIGTDISQLLFVNADFIYTIPDFSYTQINVFLRSNSNQDYPYFSKPDFSDLRLSTMDYVTSERILLGGFNFQTSRVWIALTDKYLNP